MKKEQTKYNIEVIGYLLKLVDLNITVTLRHKSRKLYVLMNDEYIPYDEVNDGIKLHVDSAMNALRLCKKFYML